MNEDKAFKKLPLAKRPIISLFSEVTGRPPENVASEIEVYARNYSLTIAEAIYRSYGRKICFEQTKGL